MSHNCQMKHYLPIVLLMTDLFCLCWVALLSSANAIVLGRHKGCKDEMASWQVLAQPGAKLRNGVIGDEVQPCLREVTHFQRHLRFVVGVDCVRERLQSTATKLSLQGALDFVVLRIGSVQ